MKRGKKKPPNKAERAYMGRVKALGCICCRNETDGERFALPLCNPATGECMEVHHMKVNPETGLHLGLGQRASHYHTLPLCFSHHGPQTEIGYHDGVNTWTAIHGTEIQLYKQVCQLLEEEA